MGSPLRRRDFLKWLSILPLVPLLRQEGCLSTAPITTSQSQETPNVFLILFDTLSARNLSIYGYHRETAPNIARFAERAIVYHSHHTAGNFTTPSTASLLTGTYPWTHRAFHHAGVVAEGQEHRNLFSLFGDSYNRIVYPHNLWVDLLVDRFREAVDVYIKPGRFSLSDDTFYSLFATDTDVAFRSFEDFLFRKVSFPGSLFLSLAYELGMLFYRRVGLREYRDLYPRGVPALGIYDVYFLLEQVIDGVIALLRSARQPILAYFHFFPPHEAYCPRHEYIGIFNDGRTAVAKEPHFLSPRLSERVLNQHRTEYDEYVAYVDAEFGRLYDFMDETGLLDNSYVVLTSDHGQLFERGVHGHDTSLLYEPVIHVPLLFSKPGQQDREDVYTPTCCVDLLPTLLHIAGQGIPDWCEGQVLPRLGGKDGNEERSVFSVEAKTNPKQSPLIRGTVALIKGQHKLIHYFGYSGYENKYELYNLADDPEELDNLYLLSSAVAADLQSELEEKLREVNQPYIS
jgi:arylsulfatase A-like enzyme